jgi:Flp pilus assembly protein TadG
LVFNKHRGIDSAMRRTTKKGQAVIELILSIVMFAIMFTLIATISVYLYMEHALVSAVREAARTGAKDQNYASGATSTGNTNVTNALTNYMSSTTGQTLTTGSGGNTQVGITPPDFVGQAYGSRTISVSVTYNITNPIQIADFLEALPGGGGAGSGTWDRIRYIPVKAAATMRYEE